MLSTVTKIIRALRIPTAEELEQSYLSSARDRIDLEHRQREIDSGKFRRHYSAYY
ncbi:DUF3563 family protein [Gemmobacter fulvus]|uniref:DUF3563 family protein n=1 Tax=Gemmobacter fulvus TaxID=2840474 RepID=A0A975S079_9RHOB|nr:DUF3563 family protein [Gemmobacter fulvus]MBT9247072.1 DUF3563 family protein [Gemmobacter fulvus]MDQ1847492.1 DUF3563 family protein [Gemmobacter fulvus]QWK89839.1 DUF3563 family protein [Gemmobacter fulvus]